VRILGEHGDSREARESDHGKGENTYSFHWLLLIFLGLIFVEVSLLAPINNMGEISSFSVA